MRVRGVKKRKEREKSEECTQRRFRADVMTNVTIRDFLKEYRYKIVCIHNASAVGV